MRKIAKFLTGFDAVVLGVIVFATYRYFEVQWLFYRFLPLAEATRFIASCLVSLVVVFSLLVFSSHIDRFKLSRTDSGEWIKWIMFLFTLFINVFFWQVWDPKIAHDLMADQPVLSFAFKGVISVFFGVFDFAYNHLFISKWNESHEQANKQENLAKLEALISKLERRRSDLERQLSEGSAKLSQIVAMHDPKVCPRCGEEFESSNQRNGHLRTCKETIQSPHSQLITLDN